MGVTSCEFIIIDHTTSTSGCILSSLES